jgi:hypothetical protein
MKSLFIASGDDTSLSSVYPQSRHPKPRNKGTACNFINTPMPVMGLDVGLALLPKAG